MSERSLWAEERERVRRQREKASWIRFWVKRLVIGSGLEFEGLKDGGFLFMVLLLAGLLVE